MQKYLSSPPELLDTDTPQSLQIKTEAYKLYIWSRYGVLSYAPESLNRQWMFLYWCANPSNNIYVIFLAWNGWNMYFYDSANATWHKITSTNI